MNPMNVMDLADSGILPFVIDAGTNRQAAIRGRLVRLNSVVDSILTRHQYPAPVAELTAEALALAASLASTMDYDGIFTLQAKGDGAIKTLLADVTAEGAVRGYAAFNPNPKTSARTPAPAPIQQLMGKGHLAFTVDQGKAGRYQGIVPIEAPNLSAVALRYFRDSEQIDTKLLLAAEHTNNQWHAAALLLQRIPETGGANGNIIPMNAEEADIWHTACTFMASLSRTELLNTNITPTQLIHRLFHQQNARILPYRTLYDECRCSPNRVKQVLESLSDEEKRELADDNNELTISCEFCKTEWSISV